jgi:tetratricopeptide (TPR) repeat protein
MGHQVHYWFLKQQARYRYRRALDQVRKGNLGVAIDTLPNALDHHPDPAAIHVTLGKTHWQAGHPDAAMEHFNRAIAADPNNVRAYGNRGLLHSLQGQADQALADWHQALQHEPNNALVHYNRGLLYVQQQQYSAALEDFDRAIASNPNLAEVYLHRGNVHQQLGHVWAAAQDWQLALCNDLNLAEARLKLQQAQITIKNAHLSQRLKAGLEFEAVEITAEYHNDEMVIEVYRPLGVGINYFTLPNQIRTLLLTWQLPGVRKFQLTARVKDQDVVELQGSYGLFRGQPCPPTRWQSVLLTTFLICPPLGILALVYAMNLHQAYRRGDYLTALRASKAIQALCRAGGGITLGLAILLTVAWGGQRLYRQFNPEPAASPSEMSPTTGKELGQPEEAEPQAEQPFIYNYTRRLQRENPMAEMSNPSSDATHQPEDTTEATEPIDD